MKMNQGVEWAIHCCALLAVVPTGRTLRLEKIAEFYDLPVPYLRKHFQALSRAGLVSTTPGPRGGYALSRDPGKISIFDIYQALEGKEPAFRCNEIRRQGPNTCGQKLYPVACNIATSMWKAEAAWRRELESVSLTDVVAEASKQISEARQQKSAEWLEAALAE
jgi:Rrf2 family protein